MHRPENPDNTAHLINIDEPLADSAPIARDFAGKFCLKNKQSGKDCSWYHGFWQELRLMGLATSPEHHSSFFPQAMEILRQGRKSLRILISGSADYSILAHMVHACRVSDIDPELTIVDSCETPLRLNNW